MKTQLWLITNLFSQNYVDCAMNVSVCVRPLGCLPDHYGRFARASVARVKCMYTQSQRLSPISNINFSNYF